MRRTQLIIRSRVPVYDFPDLVFQLTIPQTSVWYQISLLLSNIFFFKSRGPMLICCLTEIHIHAQCAVSVLCA